MTNWVPQGETGANYEYYSSSLTQQILGSLPVPLSVPNNVSLAVLYSYTITRNGSISIPTPYSQVGTTTGATNPALEDVPWSFNTVSYGTVPITYYITLLEGDILTISFISRDLSGQYLDSNPSEVVVNIVSINEINTSASIPSGIQLKLFKDNMKILIPKSSLLVSSNSDFLGCNFYISLSPGGGTNGYQLMNDTYVSTTDDSELVETIVTLSDVTSEADSTTTETKQTQQVPTEYYTFSVNKTVLTNLVNDGVISNVFLSDNVSINQDIVFYYVTTSAAYDRTLNTAVESSYSLELNGKFLQYSTDFTGLPSRTRQDILLSVVQRLTTNNNLVNVVTGQVIRDVIDPVTDMFSKFYVIEDFVFRCNSIDCLLYFDDTNGDGISDPVATSPLKTALADALGITDYTVLQSLIDQQFDKQGANFEMARKAATNSQGSVVIFTTKKPVSDLSIPDGTVVTYPGDLNLNIQPQTYTVIGDHTMEAATITNYYNPSKQRYELPASITAVTAGSIGNVPSGSITIITGVDSSLSVENDVPTDYGTDLEINSSYGARIKMARPSFDAGTKPGYTATTYGVPGVQEAIIQAAGDPLMIRDYDPTTGQHIGGKVDIYVRGTNETQIIDQVAFKFDYPTDVLGNKIGEIFYVTDASEFRIKTTNSKVTATSPIVIVSRVHNTTRNADYDLSDLVIATDTLLLSTTSPRNVSIGMATLDVIEVDYEYMSSNVLPLENQPVIELISVSDSGGNTIDPSLYQIVKSEDPLKTGNSSISTDGIEFLFSSADQLAEAITLTNEQHVIRVNLPAQLNYKGVILNTIVVQSQDLSTTYKNNIDYTITLGNQTEFTYINIKPNGMIRSGFTVSVSYEASQNFFVAYTYDSLINQVQTQINNMKHACADVIVKEAVENMVDLSFTVTRDLSVATTNNGTQTDDEMALISRIQTAVFNAVAGLQMGQTLKQSFLLKTIMEVSGVDSVETPFSIMMKRAGSYIPMDNLGTVSFEVFQNSSNSNGVVSYQSIDPVLTYSTTDGGGPSNLFRAVYENMIELNLVSDPTLVSGGPGRAAITADGRITVSTTDGSPPQTKSYTAAYYVAYPTGVTYTEDLTTDEIEYLNVDSLSFQGIDFTN
jgi:hypothetical protein